MQDLQVFTSTMKKEQLKQNPTATELKTKIQLLQHQINVILSEEIAMKIKFARQKYFENANKPGK